MAYAWPAGRPRGHGAETKFTDERPQDVVASPEEAQSHLAILSRLLQVYAYCP
eukprot:CAMPEP_0117548950 /NCGR_PEP_ID=MMETSP0784-20121206/47912_1 /TAXON_ID=39447 /ORGANISM="" /LENGTH=52 /DNA_ID=CAMNT_0005345919 /DNA_START=291 /DNA_END=446 /DNA_ORIENTATION=+